MNGHPLELAVDEEPEQEAERADDESDHQQRASRYVAEEPHLGKIWDLNVGFAAGAVLDRSHRSVAGLRRHRGALGGGTRDFLGAQVGRAENRQQREDYWECTTKKCKLPIHSEFLHG